MRSHRDDPKHTLSVGHCLGRAVRLGSGPTAASQSARPYERRRCQPPRICDLHLATSHTRSGAIGSRRTPTRTQHVVRTTFAYGLRTGKKPSVTPTTHRSRPVAWFVIGPFELPTSFVERHPLSWFAALGKELELVITPLRSLTLVTRWSKPVSRPRSRSVRLVN